jgi:carboxylate-amine ligase
MTLRMPLNTEWNPSEALTVGVEWELQILDRESLTPKNLFEDILNDLPEDLKPYIHKEIYKSMLEIVTPPAADEEEPIKALYRIFDHLKVSALRRGYHLVGLGTLFLESERPPEKNITPRYKRFIEEFGELLDDFYIYGIHIHIGFPNPEWALKAYNNLIYYAPILLALSASSPFYRGRHTGIHSFRTVIFERLPRAELPPQFETYRDYERHINELYGAGIIDTIKDVWYHIRLRPDFGTVEVRVFDSIFDVERIKVLIKLLRAISKFSNIYGYRELPHYLIKQNWWYAKRYSLDADFFAGTFNRKALKHVAFDLIFELDELGILKRLGYNRGEFLNLLRKPSPARDIEAKAKAWKSLKKVVKMAALV